MANRDRRERRESLARKSAQQNAAKGGNRLLALPRGVEAFRISEPGVKRLEFIPYPIGPKHNLVRGSGVEPGEPYHAYSFYIHGGIGSDNTPVVCLNKTYGKKCPICEHAATISWDESKEIRPKHRQLFNVYDHAAPDAGVQVWEFSYHNFGAAMDERINAADEDDVYDLYYDVVDGMTVKVSFAKKSMGSNSFFEAGSIDFKPRSAELRELVAGLADSANVLEDCLKVMKYEDIRELFYSGESSADEDEDDEPVPPRKPAKAARKPAPADDEDEEPPMPPRRSKPPAPPVADAADDWDEDDDQPAPVKPPKKAKPPAPPVDEDEDWDEEPAPPKKPVAKPAGNPSPNAKKSSSADTAKNASRSKPPVADDWDEDDDEPVPPRKPAAAKKSKPAPPPVDEDDDWDDEGE